VTIADSVLITTLQSYYVSFFLLESYDSLKSKAQYLNQYTINYKHVGQLPFHHGMARPQVADGGEGLQIWRVVTKIL